MANSSRRRNIIIVILVLLLLLALWLTRCSRPAAPKETVSAPAPVAAVPPATGASAPATKEAAEVLTAATLQFPVDVSAGATFQVQWTGPNNPSDYVTIVRQGAADGTYANYRDTHEGNPLSLTAPIEPGAWEVRYMTTRSRTVLGRGPITIRPIVAKLEAVADAVQGTSLAITWTGPNNEGDYITVVAKDTPDGQYGNYTYTKGGSPLTVTLPIATGDTELRYMTGQGNKVLARRPFKVTAAEVELSAPATAVAGSIVSVIWTGPNNASDYITFTSASAPEGQHGNYTYTNKGSPLTITAPIDAGDDELRYMTGQGNKVLARRPIGIVAADITVAAPAEAAAGAAVAIAWTGPNNPGDYLTIVAKTAPDNQHGNYAYTNRGSPVSVTAPKDAGEAEVRYISGQGSKVLARCPLKLVSGG